MMKNRRVLGLLLSVVVIALNCGAVIADEARQLKAGAATANITPPLGELIIGGWNPFPASHIHDDLHARCIVLDDGRQKVAVVVCDVLGIPREVIDLAKSRIEASLNIPGDSVIVSATHTHSATTTRGPASVMWPDELSDYQRFLAGRIADVVQCAVNQLEPAEVGWGRVDEPSEVFNRRWEVTDPELLKNPFGRTDRVRMNPPAGSAALVRPAGPIDPEIGFLSVRSKDGHPIALLANYSLHYVGGVPQGHVSADYFACFCRRLEQHFAPTVSGDRPPFVALLSNGTSGDINNINFREKGVRREPYEKMNEVADKVAAKVIAAEKTVSYLPSVSVGGIGTDLSLKLRKPDAETMNYLKTTTAAQPDQPRTKEHIYLERLTKLQNGPESVNVHLQVLKIGELSIHSIPFETFVEIGLELKQRSPFAQSFTIELANGWYGYLPTEEQHKLGGYETWIGTNFVEFTASRQITETLLKLSQQLR
ncbi:MAG: hypothetical protein R3C49_25285 [Planctomycetaceae bacterium]